MRATVRYDGAMHSKWTITIPAILATSLAIACGEEADDGPTKLTYAGTGGGGQIGDVVDDTSGTSTADGQATSSGSGGSGSSGSGSGSGGSGGGISDGGATGSGSGGPGDGGRVGISDGGATGSGSGSGSGGSGSGSGGGISDGGATGSGSGGSGSGSGGAVSDGGGVGTGSGSGGSGDGGASGSGGSGDGGASGSGGSGDGGGSGVADSGAADSGSGVVTKDGSQGKPALSCKHLKASHPTKKSGLYWIQTSKKASILRTWCDLERDGGGWTLVAVSADDGQHTWTWNNRAYWTTNKATFGDPKQLARDFKSQLYHEVAMKDLLFLHWPSGVWGAYHGVADGKLTMAQKMTQTGGPHCYKPGDGFALSAGKVGGGDMCDSRLYLSPMDHDGNDKCGDDEHAYGPAWNAGKSDDCPFNDPGERGGLGPVGKPTDKEEDSVGFGKPMGLNKGSKGANADRMWIFVR